MCVCLEKDRWLLNFSNRGGIPEELHAHPTFIGQNKEIALSGEAQKGGRSL